MEYLKEKGIRSVESLLEVQEGECVVIRSHGVAPECYEQLEAQGISYVDCTCPFVARDFMSGYPGKNPVTTRLLL